ncbi:MAG: glucan biosynthesis protein D [Methylocystis sp.]|nr:glucan biosynthesis protein D [Methylocystis sp.]
MIDKPDRRSFLKVAAASSALGAVGVTSADAAAPPSNLKLGPAEPFSFESFKETARRRVAEPYKPPTPPDPEIVGKIDYETWGKITYNTDHALFAEGPQRFPVEFFHLGMFFRKPVRMYVVEAGQAREIIYDPSYFNMPEDSIARRLPPGAGFAGFRIQEAKDGGLDWRKNDWAAFLGAAYFRAIGELRQYGLSARAIALDTWVASKSEEFPDFTNVYIGPQSDGGVAVHLLLEGPSIVGAFRFLMTRGKGVVMDIDCALFLRGSFTRFGVAPLTSMYWFSETKKPMGADWRPEVHDSDGLCMWTGAGERLWRPLNNPGRVMASAFGDNNPKGFGLLQRDRNFDHYLDGVLYDHRPSVWVEPKGDWGKGAVHLVEAPTDDEIHDNIVAMWVPEKPAVAGSAFEFSYRLHWLADEPYPPPLARCVATRLGNGGQPGKPRPAGVRKFMVEFLGGALERLPFGVKPEPVLWASRGTFSYIFTEAVSDRVPGHWRAQFDLTVEGADPVEMRLFLKSGDTVLSENWLFQYHPF